MERDGYEKIAYKLLENPKFWFNLDRIKELTGLTYWAEVHKVVAVLSDKRFIAQARESYEKLGAKYPSETAKVALKNIKAIEEVMEVLPQTTQGGKELWEMTREEFHNYWETSIASKDPSVKQRDFDKMVDSWRMSYVQRAIRDGRPVPAEVLRDYPDLAKAYGVAIPKAPVTPAVPRCRVPATLHPYAPPARQFEDEMEKLFRSDPAEFYRRKKLVNQAIKEREGGKIKTLPNISLTDLRRIKAHADSLYG